MHVRFAIIATIAMLVVATDACSDATPTFDQGTPSSAHQGTPVARPASPAGVQAIAETATDTQFSQAQLLAKAGQPVSLLFTNRGSGSHSWHLLQVQDAAGKEVSTRRLKAGTSEALTFTIVQSGSYTFQDDLHPGELHGTLIVK